MRETSIIVSIILLFSVCTYVLFSKTRRNIESAVSLAETTGYTVILDAGHGGEDGGAEAFDGTLEKDLNLSITKNIALFFDIFGVNYLLTRDCDRSLSAPSLKTIRERKTSDILARYDIINSTPRSYLLSIHQNKFSVEKYKGTQVFYSDLSQEAGEWAKCIQSAVVSSLQPENQRKSKTADRNIYLLKKAKRPSVMVECGFLSNFEELKKLKDKVYEAQLAYFICEGTLKYFNNGRE